MIDDSVPRGRTPDPKNKTGVAEMVSMLTSRGMALWTIQLTAELERPRKSKPDLMAAIIEAGGTSPEDGNLEDKFKFEPLISAGAESSRKATAGLAAALAMGEECDNQEELVMLDLAAARMVVTIARGISCAFPIYPEETVVGLMAAGADCLQTLTRSRVMTLWKALGYKAELTFPCLTTWVHGARCTVHDRAMARQLAMEYTFRSVPWFCPRYLQ